MTREYPGTFDEIVDLPEPGNGREPEPPPDWDESAMANRRFADRRACGAQIEDHRSCAI